MHIIHYTDVKERIIICYYRTMGILRYRQKDNDKIRIKDEWSFGNGNALHQTTIENAVFNKNAGNFKQQQSLIIRIRSIILSFFSTKKWKLSCEFKKLMQNLTILKKYHKRHINNPSLKWRKVGVVKHLFVYPLVNVATAQNVMSCYIHRNEIVGCNNGVPIRNHMFVVYDEKTNIIETDNEMHNFTNMIISIKDENTIILKDVNVESMPLVLKNFVVDKNRKTCIMSFAHEFLVKVEVSDCGQMAAEWLKSYTKNWNLRLGYLLRDLKPQKTFMHQYHSLNLENQNCKNMMIPFENIPCLTLLSSTSFKEVEKILPYTSLQMLRPNIFISTFEKPFNEIKWQEIKIGNAICNNVKPWKRSKSQINFTDMSIDMKKEKMLLHCEVLFPWPVKEGDNVYVLEEEDN